MRRALFLLYLAGCRGLYGVDGEHDASAPHDAPPDTPIDAPAIDAPPDAAPIRPIIADGSGDFDGDKIDNAHDPCPLDPTATGDSDGDGVGDACDPHPGTPGDCIVLFDDFATGVNWLPLGNIAFGCDPTTHTGACVNALGGLAFLLSSSAQPLFATGADAQLVFHDSGAAAGAAYAIGTRMQLDADERLVGDVCGVFRNSGVDGVAVESFTAGLPAGQVTPFPSLFNQNVAHEFVWRPTAQCGVDSDHVLASGDSGGDRVGVYMSDTKIDIRAIVAYGQHCAPAN